MQSYQAKSTTPLDAGQRRDVFYLTPSFPEAPGLAVEPHLDHAAADKINAVVEANEDQQENRRQVDRRREQDEKIPLADEIDVDVGPDQL